MARILEKVLITLLKSTLFLYLHKIIFNNVYMVLNWFMNVLPIKHSVLYHMSDER